MRSYSISLICFYIRERTFTLCRPLNGPNSACDYRRLYRGLGLDVFNRRHRIRRNKSCRFGSRRLKPPRKGPVTFFLNRGLSSQSSVFSGWFSFSVLVFSFFRGGGFNWCRIGDWLLREIWFCFQPTHLPMLKALKIGSNPTQSNVPYYISNTVSLK